MKNTVKITSMLLMLFLAGSLSLSAQRGMRGMGPDSTGMDRMRMEHRHMPREMGRPGKGPCREHPARGVYRTPGIRLMENIPDLTDKQRKDIADLKGKQMAEMEKLRIDMQSKMKELREAHKAKVMSILTDEQKKWVEENTPKPLEK
ncbi:MAG: hypothetical protein MUF36_05090 [Bacteroidales bacterium]|jgi:hypothetical protein|nr:hypothetical protein [Bacteroidales bacterium]